MTRIVPRKVVAVPMVLSSDAGMTTTRRQRTKLGILIAACAVNAASPTLASIMRSLRGSADCIGAASHPMTCCCESSTGDHFVELLHGRLNLPAAVGVRRCHPVGAYTRTVLGSMQATSFILCMRTAGARRLLRSHPRCPALPCGTAR